MKIQLPPSPTRGERFDRYLWALGDVLDHSDRIGPMRDYLTGLLLMGKRKSIEPIAARIDPSRVCARHQSLHHFISVASWSDKALLRAIDRAVLPALLKLGKIESWIVDDTGFPKRGRHSVGVGRQYCGQLGKTDNCQIAVSLSLAHKLASLPIAFELFLPEKWANDWGRRKKAGVPTTARYRTKPEIALDQIAAALNGGLPHGIVNADSGFGNNTEFREGLTRQGLKYAVGVHETTTVWPSGKGPIIPEVGDKPGSSPKLLRRDENHQPLTVRQLAEQWGHDAFRSVIWREGARGELSSQFQAERVRPAHRDFERETPRAEEWLLVEWPTTEPLPTRYYLSTLKRQTTLRKLVYVAKGRWPIERDYEELKDIGLGHYEVRGWRGFHHHAMMAIAAYAFLIMERGLFPPSRDHCQS
jgi:SRSO17 transposase